MSVFEQASDPPQRHHSFQAKLARVGAIRGYDHSGLLEIVV
jgi:hypothetical protein